MPRAVPARAVNNQRGFTARIIHATRMFCDNTCERQVSVEWRKRTLYDGTPIPSPQFDGIGVPSYEVVNNPDPPTLPVSRLSLGEAELQVRLRPRTQNAHRALHSRPKTAFGVVELGPHANLLIHRIDLTLDLTDMI